MWKEMVVDYFKVIYRHAPVGVKRTTKYFHAGVPAEIRNKYPLNKSKNLYRLSKLHRMI
jgi:hypothetical protein